MQTPTTVSFHGVPRSEAVEVAVAHWIARLDHLETKILRAEVWVDRSHHHGRDPRFRIRLALDVPGSVITVSHESGHADVHVALTDAFVAARRQLEDHIRNQRGDLASHAT